MILETKSWQEHCQLVALKFAEDVANAFKDRMDSCVGHLPTKTSETRGELLNIFIDASVGITVMNATSYAGDCSKRLEDAMVENFRHKFRELRKRSLGFPGEEAKVKIVDDPQEAQ